MCKSYFLYILSNSRHTIFYIGITNDIKRRVYEHKNKKLKGFTSKYNLSDLLYYEFSDDILEIIRREKQMKKWKRQFKLNLIKKVNPSLVDLAKDW